jgi:hypothetical protein
MRSCGSFQDMSLLLRAGQYVLGSGLRGGGNSVLTAWPCNEDGKFVCEGVVHVYSSVEK